MSACVVIYGSRWCGYSLRARRLLERKGVEFQERDVAETGVRDEMVRLSGRRTVPQVFIGRVHVGGYDDLMALEGAGGLDTLIKAEIIDG